MNGAEANKLAPNQVGSSIQTSQYGAEDDLNEIDLYAVAIRLIEKWYILFCAALLGALLMAVVTFVFTTPKYEATSKLYVLSQKDSAINLSDLQIGNYLAKDYQEVFNNRHVHEAVISRLNLPYSVEQVRKMLSVTNPSDTRILYIKVTSESPEEAQTMADTYAEVAQVFIASRMDTKEPTIFETAQKPIAPASPNKTKNIIVGFVLGFMIAGVMIFVLYILDDYIRTEDDIARYAGLVTMGSVLFQDETNTATKERQKRKAKYTVMDEETVDAKRMVLVRKPPVLDFAGQEALNAICSNLSFSGKDIRKIVMTSTMAGEGKSTMSARIAVNMASRGKRVALVDLDLRRSFVVQRLDLKFLGNGEVYGAAHYLAGHCDLDEICYSTDIPGFSLIPAGRDIANPIPLLDSEDFQTMIEELARRYDMLILDAPPVGVVVDAAEIAKCCDGVLFVVEHGKCHRRDLQASVRQMRQSECPILGCVIDKVKLNTLSDKHYYSRSYYGSYYKKESKEHEQHRRKLKKGAARLGKRTNHPDIHLKARKE